MEKTPNANRKHIVIYGKTNAGKSSLINAILGQNISLVSEKEGTTTDPVSKASEMIPVGSVLFIDTAGLGDNSSLGKMREKRTLEILKRTDIAIYVMDINDMDFIQYDKMKRKFNDLDIPYILVINKIDTVDSYKKNTIIDKYKESKLISTYSGEGIDKLKDDIITKISEGEEEVSLLGGLVPEGGTIIMVVPVDSEAPKGRLILPQVQCIRDALDNGIKSYIVRDSELEGAIQDLKKVDLVITDSQAFKKVSNIIPKEVKLTSFSILFAKQKGDIKSYMEGVKAIKNLNKNSKILICESCTHNISHEDIGRVKIPTLLDKYVGEKLHYDISIFHDFPETIKEYDLIIHCGGCMINRKTILNRIKRCNKENIPITNYGLILAYLTGILDRAIDIFK
ncbi:[FeFe] hydrogenase H-cluster maturation GTPase HydF [Clostridium bornimense]|uniref:[FeFe] hydrogenase H-cluster maturation GTPase HydF n=1 Tax=Clostridium bornimense TaxID=1216932 RepID=UPI001C0FE7E6|nr:[FeFe] hydrogenase H-cluster maturation GTPase HydF [Clostridium bornimense]MBU5315330.1 [FeFe] hydrogenase H-cluster maturation GTPase HydF [Clostridium bornimense]